MRRFLSLKRFGKILGYRTKGISPQKIIDWKNIKLFVHSYYNKRPRIIPFEKIESNIPKTNYIVVLLSFWMWNIYRVSLKKKKKKRDKNIEYVYCFNAFITTYRFQCIHGFIYTWIFRYIYIYTSYAYEWHRLYLSQVLSYCTTHFKYHIAF